MPIRSCALLHVHYDPVRSVVLGYEFALNYCPDYDMGDHDLATIGPNMHMQVLFLQPVALSQNVRIH